MTIELFRQKDVFDGSSNAHDNGYGNSNAGSDQIGNDRTKQLASEKIVLPQAEILFWPYLFGKEKSQMWFELLLNHIQWRQEQIAMYGKQVKVPRLSAWYADAGQNYVYSGIRHHPTIWSKPLLALKKKVEEFAGVSFNSVLCNLYRDGNDGVSWHSDDEPELGRNPIIASLSFGETRRFELRKKDDHAQKFKLNLFSGSCLIMQGETQHAWHHQIPKSSISLQARINLTFRSIK